MTMENMEKYVEHLKEENKRLHHLTNVLIQHIWRSGPNGLPLKDIDRQMKLFDEKNEMQV